MKGGGFSVGFSPQNFLTFSFNPDAIVTVPCIVTVQIIELEPRPPLEKRSFLGNPHKIEAMITFLTEMLKLPSFGHMTTSTI